MTSEHDAMERKYQNSTMTVSVILEGAAVGYIKDKKKRKGVRGSRGKYLSHCVVFYENNINHTTALRNTIRTLEKRVRDLESGL